MMFAALQLSPPQLRLWPQKTNDHVRTSAHYEVGLEQSLTGCLPAILNLEEDALARLSAQMSKLRRSA
jgi:hypothetical protein